MKEIEKKTGDSKNKCKDFLDEVKKTKEKILEEKKEKWFGGGQEMLEERLEDVQHMQEMVLEDIEKATDAIKEKITEKIEKAEKKLKRIRVYIGMQA